MQRSFWWRKPLPLPWRSLKRDRERLLRRLADRYSPRVVDAIARTPREAMVPPELRPDAYRDGRSTSATTRPSPSPPWSPS